MPSSARDAITVSEFTPYSPGQRIAERYLVHAMRPGVVGDVYLCLDENEELPIALKMLRLEGFDGDTERTLFELHLGEWSAIVPHPSLHYSEGDALLLVRGLD